MPPCTLQSVDQATLGFDERKDKNNIGSCLHNFIRTVKGNET